MMDFGLSMMFGIPVIFAWLYVSYRVMRFGPTGSPDRISLEQLRQKYSPTPTLAWNCSNCGGPNSRRFCAYCGRAK